MAGIPTADVRIDSAMVATLLNEQAPHLADLELAPFFHGWDNQLFALGADLLVRLPRRRAAAALIEHEIAVLPRLAPALPTPIPVPVFAGRPGGDYPWRWTVVPRLPGIAATEVPPDDRAPAASGLAEFLTALHTPADPDAPVNPFRGVRLAERATTLAERVRRAAGDAALVAWHTQAAGPAWPGAPLWVHGDLHPLNLLLHPDRTLAGVIDFGDLCSGDPASDLAVAWLMFDADARSEFRAACDSSGRYDPGVWSRAWAWALGLASVFALTSDDMPELAAIARHGLAETLADPIFAERD